ncbi:homoserine kinase [Gammaproteobacteria bacterium]|jgi:homoserine kinase|nr:homoserine kinase [Gammaproteobacteria bacterium]
MSEVVTAFAPASIGNVGVGFDMLGLALAGVGDRVSAMRTESPGITIAEVRGLDGEIHPYLATDPEHNTASIAAKALWNDYGDDGGVELRVYKGVPLQSGMGSSAASAVAAAYAVNQLLGTPVSNDRLLAYSLAGEQYASGGLHADNVAPSLLGGMIFCPQVLLPETVRLPVPDGVSAVLLHPELQVNTADARRKLAKGYSMEQWLTQQAYLGGFIAACAANDIELIGKTLKDVIIEPQRSAAVPCFDAVKAAAEAAGALGASLSGSGPSIFALCADAVATNLAMAMEQACRGLGIECQSWVSPMDAPGARLVD